MQQTQWLRVSIKVAAVAGSDSLPLVVIFYLFIYLFIYLEDA
jgi:hypothetical protein